jgi:hypothetical protein
MEKMFKLLATMISLGLLSSCATSGSFAIVNKKSPNSCITPKILLVDDLTSAAYRDVQILSGIGPNESAALSSLVSQAKELRAQGIVIEHRQFLGSLVQITAKAVILVAPSQVANIR